MLMRGVTSYEFSTCHGGAGGPSVSQSATVRCRAPALVWDLKLAMKIEFFLVWRKIFWLTRNKKNLGIIKHTTECHVLFKWASFPGYAENFCRIFILVTDCFRKFEQKRRPALGFLANNDPL